MTSPRPLLAALLACLARSGAAYAAEAPPSAASLYPYPRSLAAQPLNLPAHVVEVSIPRVANFAGTGPAPGNFYLHLRWGLTERLELREVGIFGTILRGGPGPAVGAGVALDPLGFYLSGGFALTPDAFFEASQRVGTRVALKLRERVGVSLTGLGGPLRTSLHSALGLDGYFDITDRSSFIVQLEYDYREPVGGGAGVHVLAPGVGLAVMPLRWFELRVLAGPTFSAEPAASRGMGLTAAWYALQIRSRIWGPVPE